MKKSAFLSFFLSFSVAIFGSFLTFSCSSYKISKSTEISPQNEKDKALQEAARIDLTIGKKDEKDELTGVDIAKSYQEIERYLNLASSWKKLHCAANNGFVCTKHECKTKSSDSYLIIDRKKELVKKCEGGTCESFPVKIDQVGVFVNIQSTGSKGSLIRILGDNRYKEISSVGLDAHITNGNCATYLEKKNN